MGTNKTVYTKVLTLLQQHEDLPQEEQERKRIVPQLIEAFGAWHEILPVPDAEGKRQFLRLGLSSSNLVIRDETISMMDRWGCAAEVLDILQQHHDTEAYLNRYCAGLIEEAITGGQKQMTHNVVQDNYGALDKMWRAHPDIAAEETALAEIAIKLAAAPRVPNKSVDQALLTQVLTAEADDLTVKQLAGLAHSLGLKVTFSFGPAE